MDLIHGVLLAGETRMLDTPQIQPEQTTHKLMFSKMSDINFRSGIL